ncbi:Testican-2 SPARC/osteonectin, CWCV, and [Triplophysa tibetana]|uniref:Testican-2 SPARC/osteonectin, CWCV, and n=1 Tax=Triplophysa tibetana TaxID=1572043 RepID=A0A5A9PSP2_9TELE|nr:Testican-2 SPARC/osteonectin, CWCV, and [Triplophysa tibetana]
MLLTSRARSFSSVRRLLSRDQTLVSDLSCGCRSDRIMMMRLMVIKGLFALQLLLVTVVSARDARGNALRDEEWLSSVHQYRRTVSHWNRFKDDDHIRTLEGPQTSDESVDTTKDPCVNIRCSAHKVCVAQGYQRALCVHRKKLQHSLFVGQC